MRLIRFLCFVVVIAVSVFVVYYLMNMKQSYIPKSIAPEVSNSVQETDREFPSPSVPASKPSSNDEIIKRARENIKLDEIIKMEGQHNSGEVSLISIRRNNIDNMIEQNLMSQDIRMIENVEVPLDIYGSLISFDEETIYNQGYILANVQIVGTMINISPIDEIQDTITFHFAENGKLIAYVRDFGMIPTITTVYFDENEIPFEQYFDVSDSMYIREENYEEIYNRAVRAYKEYFNYKEEN